MGDHAYLGCVGVAWLSGWSLGRLLDSCSGQSGSQLGSAGAVGWQAKLELLLAGAGAEGEARFDPGIETGAAGVECGAGS